MPLIVRESFHLEGAALEIGQQLSPEQEKKLRDAVKAGKALDAPDAHIPDDVDPQRVRALAEDAAHKIALCIPIAAPKTDLKPGDPLPAANAPAMPPAPAGPTPVPPAAVPPGPAAPPPPPAAP